VVNDSVRHGLSNVITSAFCSGELDLSERPGAPAVGWHSMPECLAVEAIRANGADDSTCRIFITLVAALDRARDADRLWEAATRTYREHRWVFAPEQVSQRSQLELADALRLRGVSQRHSVDAAVWRIICEGLQRPDLAGSVREAVYEGTGDVVSLRRGLEATTTGGSPLFPMLSGPKVGRMWIRMLAVPGNARIECLSELEVAVDVQVQKVSEYLGLTDTFGQPVEQVRDIIQNAWNQEIATHGADGPPELRGTGAALDPAVWFFGKWGCTFCERRGTKLPIHRLCDGCRFDELRRADS
jgi:hypothetical protein